MNRPLRGMTGMIKRRISGLDLTIVVLGMLSLISLRAFLPSTNEAAKSWMLITSSEPDLLAKFYDREMKNSHPFFIYLIVPALLSGNFGQEFFGVQWLSIALLAMALTVYKIAKYGLWWELIGTAFRVVGMASSSSTWLGTRWNLSLEKTTRRGECAVFCGDKTDS